MGNAYRNAVSTGVFIDYISQSLLNVLKHVLNKVHFYSILMDGSTDVSIIEKEALFIITFDPSPLGSGDMSFICGSSRSQILWRIQNCTNWWAKNCLYSFKP